MRPRLEVDVHEMVRHAVLLRRDRLLDDEADLGVHHVAAQSRTWQMRTLAGLADTDANLNKGWIFLSASPPFVLGGPVCFFFCFRIACTSAAAPAWSAAAQPGADARRASRWPGSARRRARGRFSRKSRRGSVGKAAASAFRPSRARRTSASSGRFSPTLSPACRRPSAARSRR